MKQYTGTFANGQQYMAVEVPEDIKFYKKTGNRVEYEGGKMHPYTGFLEKPAVPDDFETLGLYHTRKGEIDFSVKEEWVRKVFINDTHIGYENYANNKNWFVSIYDSLRSLLDRDSREAFPLDKNEFGFEPKPNQYNAHEDERKYYPDDKAHWEESQSQVRPETFLIILIK